MSIVVSNTNLEYVNLLIQGFYILVAGRVIFYYTTANDDFFLGKNDRCGLSITCLYNTIEASNHIKKLY